MIEEGKAGKKSSKKKTKEKKEGEEDDSSISNDNSNMPDLAMESYEYNPNSSDGTRKPLPPILFVKLLEDEELAKELQQIDFRLWNGEMRILPILDQIFTEVIYIR